MYLASGGDHWEGIMVADINGEYCLGGLRGTYHQIIDLRHGRDVLTYDLGTTRGQQGTEPTMSWWVDEKGLVTIQDAPEALADAATQSYEDRNGWFYPSPEIRATYLGHKSESGRSFDLVQVAPPTARTLTLWIDYSTHLLDRVVELDATRREETTYFSDYRKVDGIWYPFRQRSSTGDTESDVIQTATQLKLRRAMTDSEFAPPASVVKDVRLLDGTESTTVPITLTGGMIIVDVSVNGEKPLPFVLDSGASNLLTPEAAGGLHVAMEGDLSGNGVGNNQVTVHLARIARFQVGQAELSGQQFVVVPLPPVLTNRGRHEPIAGLIGYEVLRRFVVRVDYHNRRLTLTLPSAPQPSPSAERLDLHFNGRECYVAAAVDGIPGYFGVDTGDNGALTLFEAFYRAHNFPIQLPGMKGFQGGVGGEASTLLTRVGTFSLGSFTLIRPLTELHFSSSGMFASTLLGGNIGAVVFRNFTMTFDYEHRAICLEKSPDFGFSMPYNRTGVHLDLSDAGSIVVKAVTEGSPAYLAGVRAGDQLIAINGQMVAGQAFADEEDRLAQAAGTSMQLAVLRNGREEHFRLTLWERLPPDGTLKLQHGSTQ